MDAIWQWGLGVIVAIQQVHGPVLDAIHHTFPFSADGSLVQRAVRFLVGIAVLIGLDLASRAVSPAGADSLYLPLRFVRYGLLGLWMGLGAPALSRAIGLARACGPIFHVP